MPRKGQFKVLKVVTEDLYIKPYDHSSHLLLKILFCYAKILLLEASALFLCLTGPSALSLPPGCERSGNGADGPTEHSAVSVHLGKACWDSVSVLHFTQTWQLSYQRGTPWSCVHIRITNITPDFPSNSGCRIWFFSFLMPSLLHCSVLYQSRLHTCTVLCLSATFLL